MGPTKSVLSHSVDNWSVLFCFSNPGLQDSTICRALLVDQFHPSLSIGQYFEQRLAKGYKMSKKTEDDETKYLKIFRTTRHNVYPVTAVP